jgi:hypothetical protein
VIELFVVPTPDAFVSVVVDSEIDGVEVEIPEEKFARFVETGVGIEYDAAVKVADDNVIQRQETLEQHYRFQ